MNIFLDQLACKNFFSFNFPLSEFFFLYFARSSISFLMVRPLESYGGGGGREGGFFEMHRLFFVNIFLV